MAESSDVVIYWFRQDLRLSDLPGLEAACKTGKRVVPVYIHDEINPGEWSPGSASRWWLHHSLQALDQSLTAAGNKLHVFRGDAVAQLMQLANVLGAETIFCSRCHEPWAVTVEAEVHDRGTQQGVEVKRYPGALLFEPESLLNKSGLPFKVFTPFWNSCLQRGGPGPLIAAPSTIKAAGLSRIGGEVDIDALQLLPSNPDWASNWLSLWNPGEAGAALKLKGFLGGAIRGYTDGRNFPARDASSRLSAHLHFGEISPRQVWQATQAVAAASPALDEELHKFMSEVGWREFSHHLLHHFPHIPEAPFKPIFTEFPWLGGPGALAAWQQGKTGYPMVDAGMRELWATGYMQNRVRMVAASFLTKHLLIHWRAGENWFWDTLVDADLANNSGGWQWCAGSGADASPYFRIFNPTLQSQRYDADGEYLRQWLPELAALPDKFLHEPSKAPAEVLADAGVELGETYPHPIVNHSEARQAALSAYSALKSA